MFFSTGGRLPSMPRKILAATLLVLVSTGTIASASVFELTDANLLEKESTSLQEVPLTFIKFYAPWCGHCKKLAPIWDELAEDDEIPASSIRMAKVDATVEKKAAQRFGVRGFPTLLLFHGNAKYSVKYNGRREKDAMKRWLMQKVTDLPFFKVAEDFGDPSSPKSSSLYEYLTSKPLALLKVGAEAGAEKSLASRKKPSCLSGVGFSLNPQAIDGFPVVYAETGSKLLKDLVKKLKKNKSYAQSDALLRQLNDWREGAYLFRNDIEFEDRIVFYDKEADVAAQQAQDKGESPLIAFINANRAGKLITASAENQELFLQNTEPGHALAVMYSSDDAHRRLAHEAAVAQSEIDVEEQRQDNAGSTLNKAASSGGKREVKWLSGRPGTWADDFVSHFFGQKVDPPAMLLWEFGEGEDTDKVFRLASFPPKSPKDLLKFIRDWRANKLEAEKEALVTLTVENFRSVTMDETKHVLVEFYAPWCGHCKNLAPTYRSVAQHFSDRSDVVIAKLDATNKDARKVIPSISGYPTIYFYSKTSKKNPKKMEDGRKFEDFVSFVEMQMSGASAAGASEDDEEDELDDMDADDVDAPTAKKGKKVDEEDDEDEEQRVMRAAMGGQKGKGKGGQKKKSNGENNKSGVLHPCPRDADIPKCNTWCKGVMEIPHTTVLGGAMCKDGPHGPTCTCYDKEMTRPFASCVSACSNVVTTTKSASTSTGSPSSGSKQEQAEKAGKTEGKEKTKKEKMKTAMKISDADDEAEAARLTQEQAEAMVNFTHPEKPVNPKSRPGIDTMGTFVGSPDGSPRRWLLYDAKFGEGFNLQREVFPRVAHAVSVLNLRIEDRCGEAGIVGQDPDCILWGLVLPPWCNLAHWNNTGDQAPIRGWGEFFDMDLLKSLPIAVADFNELGSNEVDRVIHYSVAQKEGLISPGKPGDNFLGWADDLSTCENSGSLSRPKRSDVSKKLTFETVYSGYCAGGVISQDVRCALFRTPFENSVVDLLDDQNKDVSTVLLKNYDYLAIPDVSTMDGLGLREVVVFKKDLRRMGEKFMTEQFGGTKFIAAHCRRSDFLRVRTRTTPEGWESIIKQLRKLQKETGLKKIFIATDASEDEKAAALKLMPELVFAPQFDPQPGRQSIVEMWVAARADFFIGTQESRFTGAIQLERSFLGKTHKKSNREFAKSGNGKQPLANPKRDLGFNIWRTEAERVEL
ncbi:unnamed protein product [Amoebophrya sp. A25]|nr:unnamed protein product [Amoebophrya sp. A25]|eukprot:GSA25T00015261001.1